MPEKKIDARVRYTKMVIRDSLISLLREKPLAKITVTEICARAGVNRATFYSHYSDPTDLLYSIEDGITNDIIARLGSAFYESGSILGETLTSILEYIHDNAEVISVLFSDDADTSFQTRFVTLLEERFLSSWTTARRLNPEDAEYIYTFAATGSLGLIRKWLADGLKKSPAELAAMIQRLSDGIS